MSSPAAADTRDHGPALITAAEHAVRLAERDALVLFVWRFDMLLEGMLRGDLGWIRTAQFAAGREMPPEVIAWHHGRERLSPGALAAVAMWFLAEAATRSVEEGAPLALMSAQKVIAQWEALGAEAQVPSA